jgi:BolA protein
MTKTQEIETRLREAFDPQELLVRDDSESHRGHAGFQVGGESHYHVVIRSLSFQGRSRLQNHRAVHAALGQDLIGRIHALSLDLGA